MRILKPLPGALPMPERNLLGDWVMHSLDDRILDYSFNDNIGTFGGGVARPSWDNGNFGIAVRFDGGDAVLTNYKPDPRQPITVVAWYNKTADAGYLFGCHDGVNRFYVGDAFIGVGDTAINTHSLPTGALHQVALVVTGTHAYWFVDGVLDDDFAYTASAASTLTFYIGRRNHATGGPITGLIERMILYNRALSASEIAFYKDPGYRYPENRCFAVA